MKNQRNLPFGRTANQKIVAVNNNMGFKGIQNQQGTTRIIYDAVKLSNQTTNNVLLFFNEVNKKSFPLTNLTENKLQVGESMAVQRYSFSILEVIASTGEVEAVQPLSYFPELQGLYRSDFSFNIAQDQVIKKMPLHSMYAPFNRNSKFVGAYQFGTQQTIAGTNNFQSLMVPHDVMHLDNDIIIPPQIEFYGALQMPIFDLPVFQGRDFYLMCTLEGLGSLFAPKSTY